MSSSMWIEKPCGPRHGIQGWIPVARYPGEVAKLAWFRFSLFEVTPTQGTRKMLFGGGTRQRLRAPVKQGSEFPVGLNSGQREKTRKMARRPRKGPRG